MSTKKNNEENQGQAKPSGGIDFNAIMAAAYAATAKSNAENEEDTESDFDDATDEDNGDSESDAANLGILNNTFGAFEEEGISTDSAKSLATEAYSRKEYEEAFKYYKIAAEEGDTYSQYCLGFMLHRGQGVDKNLNTASEWLKKAVKNGSDHAATELEKLEEEIEEKKREENAVITAYEYYQGKNGKPQDYEKAGHYFKIGAEAGNAMCMGMLGSMMWSGEGIPEDKECAVNWMQKAVDLGDKGAEKLLISRMSTLGGNYYLGSDGVTQDFEKAAYWTQKGADKGNDFSMYLLYDMYCKGNGVNKDMKLALKWLRKSAGLGHEGAINKLQSIMDWDDDD